MGTKSLIEGASRLHFFSAASEKEKPQCAGQSISETLNKLQKLVARRLMPPEWGLGAHNAG